MMVKSALRTLQIFELFAELRRPATVSEIHQRLSLPQSSTSKLLDTFRKLGYLQYAPATHTYVPTIRAAALSVWMEERWFADESLLRAMRAVHRELGTSVILGIQNDKHVLYVMALPATAMPRPPLPIGTLRPIARAAAGKALLMTKPAREIDLLVRRINAEEDDASHRLEPAALRRHIAACRRRGYATSDGAVIPGVSVVAIPLPKMDGHPQLSLGIGGPQDWLDANLARCLKALKGVAALCVPAPSHMAPSRME